MATAIFYLLLLLGIIVLTKYIKYRGSDYKIASGNSFLKTLFDKGNFQSYMAK